MSVNKKNTNRKNAPTRQAPVPEKSPVSGTLELDGRGGGFLRSEKIDFRKQQNDAFVSPAICKEFRFVGGENVIALASVANNSNSRSNNKAPKCTEIQTIDGSPPEERLEKTPFDKLVALDPSKRLRLATTGGPTSMRIMDLMTPVGFGQRGLIVAAPRTGKTMLLQQIANGISANHPDAHLMVLLVDERPEEVTDMKRSVQGEVIASSNDNDLAAHIRLAKLVISRAKRLVEVGCDVVILMDSLTRLGRAFNSNRRGSGRIMSGGLDSTALIEPKSIFGSARNAEDGGSLTILATALIETGSRMDDVIFNEFKGTGNMELVLSRELANRRIWPALDLNSSGTRKEEKLLSADELEAANGIRRNFQGKDPAQVIENLLETMEKYPNIKDFVDRTRTRRFR